MTLSHSLFTMLFSFVLLALPRSAGAADAAPWVIEPAEALQWIEEEDATVLDTRSMIRFRVRHVEGALRADWTDFSKKPKSERGELLDDEALQKKIRALGIDQKRPVVVVGSPPDDWGEDGRIVWMLRTAGHNRVALVDGGYDALVAAGAPTQTLITKANPKRGDFVVRRVDAYDASAEDVAAAMSDDDVVIIDTREKREFEGGTPYGEERGGHVPGAKHLYYKSLLDDDGELLDPEQIEKHLAEVGVTRDTSVIAYCTGGVRSGWLVAVLQSIGITDARNYSGSMWQWAARPAEDYPLQK